MFEMPVDFVWTCLPEEKKKNYNYTAHVMNKK